MSVRNDVSHYGRRLSKSINLDAQTDMRHFTQIVEKLARAVEELEERVSRIEKR
jgi:hypothetical protein